MCVCVCEREREKKLSLYTSLKVIKLNVSLGFVLLCRSKKGFIGQKAFDNTVLLVLAFSYYCMECYERVGLCHAHIKLYKAGRFPCSNSLRNFLEFRVLN